MKKVYELARDLGIKSKDVIALFEGHDRINHHHDKLRDTEVEFVMGLILEEPAQQVDEAEVEGCTAPLILEEEVSEEIKELAWRCLGVKSPYYKG